jgi:hypothetical protein
MQWYYKLNSFPLEQPVDYEYGNTWYFFHHHAQVAFFVKKALLYKYNVLLK